jgi:putative flippase GtrA
MRQLILYMAVGGSTAFIYLIVAIGATHILAAPPLWASLGGFVAAMPLSYLGHKLLTFRSVGKHREELPRFVIVYIVGLLISAVVPEGTVARWHWPPLVGYLAACVSVPTLNYVLMWFWIFVDKRKPEAVSAAPESARGR